MTTNQVELAFPRGCVTVHDDRVIIHLGRKHLPELRSFLEALERGYTEFTPLDHAARGQG